MKKFLGLSIIFFTLYSCGPSACDCLDTVDDNLSYFGNDSFSQARKKAECYEKFSDEEYQKYTEADEWQKQAEHAARLQPIARAKMIEECNRN
jgi:hypothetical protein|nr:hypothetical protein [uncultured Flavobacterium sp.]